MTQIGVTVKDYTEVLNDVILLTTLENKQINTDAPNTGAIENGEQKQLNPENKFGLVWLNPASCCYAIYSKLKPDEVLLQQSPLTLAKALKVGLVLHTIQICCNNFFFHAFMQILLFKWVCINLIVNLLFIFSETK